MTELVEPVCELVDLEVSVALAARGGTGILQARSFNSVAESERRKKRLPVMAL